MGWEATGVLGGPRPWSSELIVNSAALADGYNDGDGGVMCDAPITLQSMVFRVGQAGLLVGGSGDLTIQWFVGDSFAAEATLLTTTTIAAGAQAALYPLVTPVDLTVNAVLRAKFTRNLTTVTGKCHVQWRGVYR